MLYPSRILLAVTGLTPQVVTETVYAVVRNGAAPPTEIHVLTTTKGREQVRDKLLGKDPGWFARLCRDYRLPPITFDETCLHVIQDPAGLALEDIRTPSDSDLAADGITEQVRRLTQNPDCQLHVSLAGGRKTMGFYAGYALSLFGRPQDRLSHVLVSAPYESLPGFFYPTPDSQRITVRDDVEVDARDAEVTLADVPFLRLRHSLPNGLLTGAARFSEIVRTAQQALGPPDLRIDYAGRRLVARGVAIDLSPVDLAFYGWLARRALRGAEPVRRPGKKDVPDYEYTAEFLAEYQYLDGDPEVRDRTLKAVRQGMETAWFDDRLNSVQKRIREVLTYAAAPYLIADSGRRPKHYRLALPSEYIRFE
jgi:CRISPR-associated protein (TIGR02584 family)